MRRGSKPAKSKEAKPPVARKSPKGNARVRDLVEKRLAESLKREKVTGKLLQHKHRELTESWDEQTATSDILKVIASTPTDLTTVFETILRSAVRLFNAYGGSIRRFDGELVHLESVTSPNPEADDR